MKPDLAVVNIITYFLKLFQSVCVTVFLKIFEDRERVTEQVITHWFQNKRKINRKGNLFFLILSL
jgi:hypothetical protein